MNMIDFFRSTPMRPYPHNETCAGTYPTTVEQYNPYFDRIDPARLGIAGHSLGATGVSVVQGYGAEGADPWPGLLDTENPVKVAVAWDCLGASDGSGGNPAEVPRVPAMGQCSEYGIGGAPFNAPPDPEDKKTAFTAWQAAGIPVYEQTIQGSTHFEWSLIPTFPATSWCASTSHGVCEGGWGNPFAQFYSVAWIDRWLKNPGEKGYADADARLLDDHDWCDHYSFYFRSARDFPDRQGAVHHSDDVRADCLAAIPGADKSASKAVGSGTLLGAFAPGSLLVLLLPWLVRRRPRN